MKQKIVVSVPMHCDKCRTKALKIAAAAHGVNKVSIEVDKGHMEVIGDGVDSVCLTSLLRKKLGFATIVKVEEVKGAKDDKKEEKATPPPGCVQYCPPMYYELVDEYPEPVQCSIM
ncbi:hypothetical protein PRUPE_6G030400 [Prunus persica]|uniref:HMA domain-containing protein n=1 Tax=Prunus persica TaxID=3760 RepID=M5W1W4_PRUPE|nr:heavy metal-associated isoprenylated plant protein 41 [Prunus persica]ONH99454.1 hypothetical protein PRUPE_6G030400 [Prunus persica]